ncbi:N-methyltryptophan oxidase [Acrocarpospora corrugata]|uniref:N-methyltryptophan oxidase n=1 Tax=Acrocarpospora corrugata TaxID=35763 RepID=A0A5M3W580_9ACTN|nr:FAD-dependent oxidoreductase [Acrocarpospora corrugata]GES02423.1 N-methyltryptophan oxidase [Acrocarpospora corrugata]
MIVVVGAGLMGAAAAWQLARRGHEVTLIEAFDAGHRHGSSHGTSRIYRRAYADPFYVELTGRAGDAWRELEDETGAELLQVTGGLDLGAGRDPEGLARVLAAGGVPHELLTAAAAAERWPQIRFDGPVLHHPEAGVVNPDAMVAACVRRVARFRPGTRVTAIERAGQGVRLHLGEEDLLADRVIVAAGSWLPDLQPEIPLTVTQQQVFHFPLRDPTTAWPILVSKDRDQIFGLPSGADGGTAPAYKVAQHDGGTPTTAATRDGVVSPASRALVSAWVADRLPGLDPRPVAEATCLYTTTPDEDFILDRTGPIVIVSPCSGHGAKFAPLIGALAADLALGDTDPHPRFALRRFRAGTAG